MLEIKNLKAGYEGKSVVEISGFKLAPGENGLILGASGSGKTTLLYAIAGLLKVLSGEIIIDGTDITTLKAAAADRFRVRHIGIIFQTLHTVAALSVLDNLLLANYATGARENSEKAEKWLGRLNLAEHKHKKPAQLSQGQLQRLSIARAALNHPALILGDEPTSALDDASCKMTMELLLGAARQSGASLLVATHDSRIKHYFTRIIDLGSGR